MVDKNVSGLQILLKAAIHKNVPVIVIKYQKLSSITQNNQTLKIAFSSNVRVNYFYRQLTANGTLGGLEPAQENVEVEKEPTAEKLRSSQNMEAKTALGCQKSPRIVTSKNVLVWI